MRWFQMVILILFFACKSAQQPDGTQKSPVPFYVRLFFEKENITSVNFKPNECGDKVLCLYIRGEQQRVIDYVVYSLKSESELYGSGIIGGDVSWFNNDELIISGTSRVEPNAVTITNVVTGESRYETRDVPKKK